MEKTFNPINNMWSLDTDAGHILHKIGSSDYPELRHLTVKADHVDAWEEIAVADIPPYTKDEYDAEVERLISERYSYGKEIEINRERDTKPESYAEYLAYVDQCKVSARENLATRRGGEA